MAQTRMALCANGNITQMPNTGTMVYDGRNRMVSLNALPAAYDPDNRRVFHVESAPVVDFWLPNGEKLMTLSVQDAPSQGAGVVECSPKRKYFWFGGRMVGSKGSGNSQEWMQPDRLGSHARVYPYGEEIAATTTSYKFATYQRGGGGLDYAMNRHYSPVYGRFMSADPYRASAGPSDPGSWNRYAYVQGDPVNFNDPMGLLACPANYQVSMTYNGTTFVTTVIHSCFLVIEGSSGWNAKTFSTHYIGNQADYESGSCVTTAGMNCSEENRVTASVLDAVQTILDVAGMIPGVGEPLDLANAIISTARGDGAGAVLSLASALPVGGQAVAGMRVLRRNMVAVHGAEAAKGMHAHHLLPQQFRNVFESKDLLIDDAAHGIFLDSRDHRKLHGMFRYNANWDT